MIGAARSTAAILACLVAAACSETPPAGQLDGSFLIGDGPSPLDAAPRDATSGGDRGPADPDDATDDAGPTPNGPDGGRDATTGDARDAGLADGGDAAPPDPCTQTATITVTATTVLARAAALDGLVVDVVATATLSAPSCTRRSCTEANPCCNDCTAEVLLDDGLPLRAGACAARVGCLGNECNLVCSPPVLGFPQTFRGVVRASPAPGLELMRVLP